MMRLNTMLTITVCSLVSSIFLNLLFFGVILQLALLIIGFLGVFHIVFVWAFVIEEDFGLSGVEK